MEKGRDGRKGKEKQSEKWRGGQNGNQKERDNREPEKQTKNIAGKKFFKVFLREQSTEQLIIPQAFQEFIEEVHNNRPVSLRGPSGNKWQVVLRSDSQGLRFTKGWKDFSINHSLKSGHFLVFTYNGRSEFSVDIFCPMGIEEKSAFDIQPCKEITVKQEVQDLVYEEVAPILKISTPPMEKGDGSRRKKVRKLNENGAQKNLPYETENQKSEARIGTSKAAPALVNSNRDSPCLLGKDSSKNVAQFNGTNNVPKKATCYDSSRNMAQYTKSKDVPRQGAFISKKLRQPTMISQRRPVTEQEKEHALKIAKEFNSRKPFDVQVMMGSHVDSGFFLIMGHTFVREWMPKASKKMKLSDPRGKSWEVTYVYDNASGLAGFSAGWGKFARGNKLERFDVCVFELLREDKIKVHIYKASC